jgi:hypothetical protein
VLTDRPDGDFRHDYEPGRDLLRLEYLGHVTGALLLREMDARFRIPGVTRRTLFLAVCVHAEIDEVDLATLTAYQDAKRDRGYPDLRTAMVVPDRPDYLALAELWAATKPGGKGTGAGIFVNESSALEWLLGPATNFR